MKAKILLATENNEYHIKVEGRATFEVSSPLRSLAMKIDYEALKGIFINLEPCTGMDSTFIGVIAMLGLHAKKKGVPAVIQNASENNKKLLNGLGVQKIFTYSENQYAGIKQWTESTPSLQPSTIETAKTVLNAHETLMNIDESNIPRFQSVVDFVKKDLEKEEKKGKP